MKKLGMIVKLLLFLLCTVLIVYLYPKEGKFRFEFQKGKPWMHDLLVAPYDFPVYKADAEVSAEKDSIDKIALPYFDMDDNIYNQQLKDFKKAFYGNWDQFIERVNSEGDKGKLNKIFGKDQDKFPEDLLSEALKFTVGLLDFIYSKGIVQESEIYKNLKENDGQLVIVQKGVAKEHNVNEVFTAEMAEEYIANKISNTIIDRTVTDDRLAEFYKELNLENYVLPNIYLNNKKTTQEKNTMLARVSLTKGMIQEGEKIIDRGNLVNHHDFQVLESLKKEYESRLGSSNDFYLILIGQCILVLSVMIVMFLFLLNFRLDILENNRKTIFLLMIVVLFVFVASMMIKVPAISIYVVPFAMLPIIIRTFYDGRLALFVNLVTILVIGFIVPNPFEFIFLQIISGVIAVLSMTGVKRRGQLLSAALMVFITYSFIYFGMAIIQEGNLTNIDWLNFAWFGGNSLLLLLTYPLIFIFEKIFGFVSDITLMELSDTNQPLLRKLNENAPGTFQHSLQVANLAEEAIYLIGGNPLLARTGALYHDIGKMAVPEFFIENQAPGQNPHDGLDFDKSAERIISHVTGGIEIAAKYKLPAQIVDFIRTHHGPGKVTYFYRSYQNKFPDEKIDEKKFSYPGPAPETKETAVVMMADSVEAASRSLKVYNEQTISELVDKIIGYQVEQGMFEQADLTFKQVTAVKNVLKKKLKNIYHGRIEYPEEKKKKDGEKK